MKSLHDNGISILGLLTGSVPGTFINLFFPSKNYISPSKDIDRYLDFARQTCQRYRQYITHWQIWNEQNSRRFWIDEPDPEEYLHLFISAAKSVKAVSQKNKLLVGGIVGDSFTWFPTIKKNYFSRLVDLGIDKYADYYSFHSYVPGCYVSVKKNRDAILKKTIRETEHFIRKFPNKPIWITEFGISQLYSLKQEDISLVYRGFLRYCTQKKMPVFFWTFSDMVTGEYSRINPEQYFGFIDKEGNRKVLFLKMKENRES
ncbi:MAG: cellulase family glycosylhydrolase [Nanoarchaeota archaeon]|nr:cellulase family glycosylhydrolase [Nanoarchaeota archaeon]